MQDFVTVVTMRMTKYKTLIENIIKNTKGQCQRLYSSLYGEMWMCRRQPAGDSLSVYNWSRLLFSTSNGIWRLYSSFFFFDKKRKLFGVIVPSELSRYLAILLYNGTRGLLTGNERGWCFLCT